MQELDKALDDAMRFEQSLHLFVVMRLRDAGVLLTKREQSRVLVNNDSETGLLNITIPSEIAERLPVDFEINPEDAVAFHNGRVRKLIADVPNVVKRASNSQFHSLYRNLEDYVRQLHFARDSFESDYLQNYGTAFALMDTYISLAQDYGSKLATTLTVDEVPGRRTLAEVLIGLHARACQVSEEIAVLVRHGYADGALARWRTLYEIAVTAILIAEKGEHLAVRYLDHVAVETFNEMKEHDLNAERLGYQPVSKSVRNRNQLALDHVKSRYGDAFITDYGWAIGYITANNSKRPTFADIVRSIDFSHWKPFYKLANNAVHAGAKGSLFKIGVLEDDGITATSSATDYGFSEPVQNMAISLLQVTSCMLQLRTNIEALVLLEVMNKLKKKLVAEILRKERLVRSHFRKQKGKKNS